MPDDTSPPGPKDIDNAVLEELRRCPSGLSFGALWPRLGRAFYRPVDRSLQRLRKRKLVKLRGRTWVAAFSVEHP